MLSWTLGVAPSEMRLNCIYASTHVPSFEPSYQQRSGLGRFANIGSTVRPIGSQAQGRSGLEEK
jgi:hypothetical protein